MFHDPSNPMVEQVTLEIPAPREDAGPRSIKVASVGGVEVDVAGNRLRLPKPGDEPLVVGPLIVRAIDLGGGDFMHEIRNAR